MYKYIILCLCVSVSGVLCDLNKEEGAECEWEGLKGKCVKETRCMTTLDENGPKHPVCSRTEGEVTIICCTDCLLVENTKDAVFSPTSGIYWKNGRKARDSCLQYLKDLPYTCKQDGFYGGITRKLDEQNQCYKYVGWAVGGAPAKGRKPSAEYPHQVILGYGNDAETADWKTGGFIISDKYIVTVAPIRRRNSEEDLKFVAMGVRNRSASPASWQIREIKRVILHPEYKAPSHYHKIALIETDTPIKFDENVLPACLHVDEDAAVEDAVTTTWFNLEIPHRDTLTDTIQTIKVQESSEEECKAGYVPDRKLKQGYDHTTQMCYGSKTDSDNTCKGMSGEPLLVDTQFSSCIHTAIGVFTLARCASSIPAVFTRVANYVPWIESIVWP